MKTDHELIKAFQNGNQIAFEELVRRHLPRVLGFFCKFTQDEMAADDLAQDVFLKLYRSLPKFRFDAEFQTYLYKINLNHANTYIRRNRWKQLLRFDQLTEQPDTVVSNDPEWTKRELWQAVAGLPKKQRLVVMMRVSQELPFRDIAGILDMSPGSAKVNYHHAITKLKNLLGVN